MSVENTQGQWQAQPLQQQMQQMPQEEGEFDTGTGDEGVIEEEGQGPTGYSEFASQILKDVPEEHKSILEPYVKKWDSGTTRRFQDLHNQYKPYKDLGWDEETTQQMAEVYRVLNEEPERMYETLKELLEIDAQEQEPPVGNQLDPELSGVPPEVMQQITQQQQVLEALAQYVLEDHTTKTTAMEDTEFEGYLDLLKGEYGDFDVKYVTALIANGIDGEAAVKQYQETVQEILNRASQATEGLPPAMLSSAGGGAVAQQEPQKLGSIDSKDIKNLVANVLGQANQAGQ